MIKSIEESEKFRRSFEKLDKEYRLRAEKLIKKIIENPETGKPMMYTRKGTREVYMQPFRISYAYNKDEEKLYLLDIYHKDEQ